MTKKIIIAIAIRPTKSGKKTKARLLFFTVYVPAVNKLSYQYV
jgi:hypothetical protein